MAIIIESRSGVNANVHPGVSPENLVEYS